MLNIIPAEYYKLFFNALITILVVVWCATNSHLTDRQIVDRSPSNKDLRGALILTISLILFFGFRNPFSPVFADSSGYAWVYKEIGRGASSIWYQAAENSTEFVWDKAEIFFSTHGFGVTFWFTLVAAVYIGGIFYAVKCFFPNNIYLGCLFAFLNFGFFSGAVNGLRNWSALSLILIAIYFLSCKPMRWLPAAIIAIVAYGIHHSVVLPIICLIASLFLIKKPIYAISIWMLSVIASLFVGDDLSSLFFGLGFDDRMDKYLAASNNAAMMAKSFSHVGFRWDFLLFSAVPIIWGWYIIKQKHLADRTYNIIFNTYVLANSFWVLVIRVSFSNRFAALSWFLYFLVISYPLLKFRIFPHQGQKIVVALTFLLLITLVI